MMRFMIDDKVSYAGKKFAGILSGKVGIVVGRVAGTESGIVVEFEKDAYVLDENKHLSVFVPSQKLPPREEKEIKVEMRRRASIDEDED